MNESDTVRLEGFAESLKSNRIFCVGTPSLLPALVQSRVASIDTEVAHRGRKVLCIQDSSPHTVWLLRMKWDAIFILRDSTDMRLALTYVVSAQKPVRVVWAGEPIMPFITHLEKHEQITIMGLGTAPPNLLTWNAIFWTHDTAVDLIESSLIVRIGSATLSKYNLRSVLKEIKASEVGLVWSSIRESDKRGSIYWFDPAEDGAIASVYSLQDAADILRSVADSLSSSSFKKS